MLGSIDVGSNTVRLLLGSVDNGALIPHSYTRFITRLKGGQTVQGLAPEAMERTLTVLRQFASIIQQHDCSSVRCVGTEALRSAANADDFVAKVLERSGLVLEIIDGEEESLLTAAGVLAGLKSSPDKALVFDIGGGSTEFVLVYQGDIAFKRSCQLGVVDLIESLPDEKERSKQIHATITKLFSEVEPVIHRLGINLDELTLIGTAGTATTLAAIDMEMTEYDWRRVNGYQLESEMIGSIYSRLVNMSVTEREFLPGMEPGRGDLIPAGTEIVMEIMRQFSCQILTISDFGLLEGVLLKMPSDDGSNR